MPRRFLMLLALLVATMALVAACGGDDGEDDEASPTASAGSPAASATPEVYPLTVTDLLGNEVTIEAEPQRIVAASPSTIELLYAAGGTAVARSTSARNPASVSALPDIGRAEAPTYELIVAQAPDLVLADSSLQAQFASNFASSLAGVPVLFIGAQKYDDVAKSLEIIGEVINKPEAAAEAVEAMEDAKAQTAELVEGQTKPRTLILIGAPNDPFVALTDSFVGDLTALAGGENIAAGEPQSGPLPGYTKLSLEQIVAADPEVILTITAGRPGGPSLADGIKANPAYGTLTAIANDRVHNLDVEVFLQAPGPRAAQGLVELAGLLYPEATAASPTATGTSAAASPTATSAGN